ncbi:MAG TPA: hypothetical protein DIV39_09265 [Verrucomicrobiales bacterium]|nr:hypothetical protein [Verrucomicrobiales bacterium]
MILVSESLDGRVQVLGSGKYGFGWAPGPFWASSHRKKAQDAEKVHYTRMNSLRDCATWTKIRQEALVGL